VSGGDLLNYILNSQPTEDRAREIFCELVDAVEYIHEKGRISVKFSLMRRNRSSRSEGLQSVRIYET
jgi:serine/threonine protein kinase